MGQKTLFIGAGNMGRAIIKGYLSAGGDALSITIVDPTVSELVQQELPGVGIYPTIEGLPSGVEFDFVVLAVKPQVFQSISLGISKIVSKNSTIISIMAGVDSTTIQTAILDKISVIRCMPNMAASVGYSANVAYTTDGTKRAAFEHLFGGAGPVTWVQEEAQIHLTTAVSGSGPAYFFAFTEALAAAGAREGLDAQLALDLAIDTLIGAGELLKQTRDPCSLRQSVTSKGGTTAAALDAFAFNGNLNAIVDDAVSAAVARSKELAAMS